VETNQRARIRAGDPDAFGLLFEECARAVYNQAFRLTGSWPAAEEAVSLTFLEAWRLRQRVEPEGGSLRPWVLGISLNVTRNLSRAERRHKAAMDRLPPDRGLPDIADEVAGRVDDAARLEAVQAALGQLRRADREVLVLCVWSGLEYAAAAQVLGIPVGTVRSRLARARRKLQVMTDGEPRPAGEQVTGRTAAAARPTKRRTP
jgi:RNA polymerase sigma-70 factor (ECF subfamily)